MIRGDGSCRETGRKTEERVKRFVSLVLLTSALLLFAADASAFGKNKIVYDEFDWKIYSSTHFDVYYYEEARDSLQKVVNLAESAYDEISRKFDYQIENRIPLIYYATHSAFQQTNVILMFIPEGVGAFAEPVKKRMVLPIDLPDEKLYALIKHELVHIFEYEIIFQGKLGREIRVRPPLWLMEGLASFMAEDEDTTDLMVLRDAVVNDIVPSVGQDVGGFFAYRFGNAVFEFMTDRWGLEGLREFIYEYRNSIGGSIERPLRRTFDLTLEEFDTQFRGWLRRQYLPALIAKGEPMEYGSPFRVSERRSQEMSPVPAPSGDLMAAFTTYKEDVDIALFNVPKRRIFRNISAGYTTDYEHVVAQFLTTGPVMGRDVTFSPDGDRVAFFAKKERGRHLIIVNALSGKIEKSVRMDVEQQLNPAFSPDGRRVAFHGFRGNRADIYLYDNETETIVNLTDDEFFNAAPAFSPDGQWLVYASVVDGYSKLFRLDLSNPERRVQITRGEWNDRDPWYSPDGKRIFFASDRPTARTLAVLESGVLDQATERMREDLKTPPPDESKFASYNIYSIHLENGQITQFTDVIGGSFTPVVFIGPEGKETLVFASYYKGNWSLYSSPTADNLGIADVVEMKVEPMLGDRVPFLPPVEVALDPGSFRDRDRFRLFVENVSVAAGVTSDQTFVSRSVISMSDMLGDRRFIASLDSVSTFSNFDFLYLDLRKRWNWGARVFDNRTYYLDSERLDDRTPDRRRLYRQTGALGLLSYPLDRYRRAETGVGYLYRSIDLPILLFDPEEGTSERDVLSFSDDFPFVFAAFIGDTTVFKNFGPISGRRYYVNTQYLVDMDGGGALSTDVEMDLRQYYQISPRSLLASRIFGGYSEGNRPNFYYFGGLNTLRGYPFRSVVGNRAFYGNFEYRFPLVDVIASPVLQIRNVRGSLFVDVGGAWFDDQDFELWRDGRLGDALASVGWGINFRFMGLELHWDFARRTDFRSIEGETRTSFWIGQTF
jgi:Tol biopolymer transport system component